jgi:competence protein ComEC
LAVSGLHVGIIYALLLFLLKPLANYSWNRWITFVISIICLWSFAFITGLSPSVLRAVTMFSFIALARSLGWKTNIYNTLACSAFILLLYNPFLIMSVGFQLSYLAVLGIVYLQKPLYNLIEIENRTGDWFWQITCVSIAAQFSTFTLGILYFHQFPSYFLVSNLFVIPLSTAVLVFGLIIMVTSGYPALASVIGLLETYMIKLLNAIVIYVEQLPFSLIENIHLTTFQCWLIMIFLVGLILMFETRSIKFGYFSLLVSLLIISTQWIHFNEQVDRNQFIVYSISGHSAIEWIDKGHSYFVADNSLLGDNDRIRFHVRPNRLNSGVIDYNNNIPFRIELGNGNSLFRWKDKTILFCKDENNKLNNLGKVDYLIIANNSFEPNQLIKIYANKVILDGTNSLSYINTWKKMAIVENIDLYSVLDEGAFILKN